MLGEDIISLISQGIRRSFDTPFLISQGTLSRIRNDHLEVISLDTKAGLKQYDILFGVYALCDPSCLEKRGFISVARLTEDYPDGFPLSDAANERARIFNEATLPVIQETVVPFFLRCHDSAEALSESIYTLNHEIKKQLSFEPQNESVGAAKTDCSEKLVLSRDLFYLAMKSSNRLFMERHFSSSIDACLQELDNATMHFDPFCADAELYINKINQLSARLLQVEDLRSITRNSKRLQELIRKNEQKTIAKRNLEFSSLYEARTQD